MLVGGGTGSEGLRRRGRRSGTRKRDSPREPSCAEPVRAKATDTSLSVALENHLTPFKLYWGPKTATFPADVAVVSVRETSDPPGRC